MLQTSMESASSILVSLWPGPPQHDTLLGTICKNHCELPQNVKYDAITKNTLNNYIEK